MPRGAKPKSYPTEQVEQVRRLYHDEGKTQTEIASDLGMTQKIVWNIMQLVEGRTAYQGNQVPCTLLWKDGHPDFSELDPKKVTRCLKEKLCGICGQMLGKQIAFIGGSKSTVFLDPPNHPACAETAFTGCPFLRNQRIRDSADSGDYQLFPASGFDYDPRTLQSWPRPAMITPS